MINTFIFKITLENWFFIMNGIYSLLSAAKAQQRRLETTSNNLANVNTPGFKGDQAVFREFLNDAIGQDLESEEEQFVHHEFISPFSYGGTSYTITDGIVPNMSNGSFKNTGKNLDIAIGSRGFFTVETPHGQRYTRNGQFQRNADGFLITQSGDKVLGEKGPIQLNGSSIVIGNTGTIMVDGKNIDNLKITDFKKESELMKLGNNYWVPHNKTQIPQKAENISIMQGFIESSNVNTVPEMVNMITVNRAFGASQNAIRSIDELDSKSISLAKT